MPTKDYADFPPVAVRLRVQLVARASRGRNRKVLLSQEIENPELNERIPLQIPSSLDVPYGTPLSLTVQRLAGDATNLTGGILSLRLKPRRGAQ